MHLIEVADKSGRIIHLSRERWKHITTEHPEITQFQHIIETLTNPQRINESTYDQNVKWYYREHKEHKRYLLVAVKYLNGHGFVITAHFVRNIK